MLRIFAYVTAKAHLTTTHTRIKQDVTVEKCEKSATHFRLSEKKVCSTTTLNAKQKYCNFITSILNQPQK